MIRNIRLNNIVKKNDNLICVYNRFGDNGLEFGYKFMIDDSMIISLDYGEDLVGECLVNVIMCEEGGIRSLNDLNNDNVGGV